VSAVPATDPYEPDTLPLTGERTVPGISAENYWFRRHEAAYEWALRLAGGRVLEVGCGEGYGTALLATAAERVVGLDYDALTVAHAARTYPAARFVRGNLAALPVATGTVDLLATLQVIEHVWDHPQFVRECARVLGSDGTLLVTTPNRLTFSPGRDEPVNPFHTKEFTATELAGLLDACGLRVTWLGGLFAGPRLDALDVTFGPSFVDAQLATPPDEWNGTLRAAVASVTTSDFAVLGERDADVDAALDLVVLATPVH
jgi:SAM-dependent methyltransferase